MNMTQFNDLSVEALAIVANDAAEQVETNARLTVENAERCGRAMLAAKEKLPHGEFLPWVAREFNYSQQTASRYMTIAANYSRVGGLSEATSINEALRLISEDPNTAKRARRGSVTVVDELQDPAESKDVIEVEATPVKEPREPKPSANPRSSAALSSSKPAPEFDLGSSLDEHRSAILEMATDYHIAKKTKHFIVMLRKVAADLEVATP
jgi:hypothetical protein